MENLTFYDFEKVSRRRISGYKIRIYNKPGNRTITFSGEYIGEINQMPTPKFRIAENNLTGEIYLVINSQTGIEIKRLNHKTSKTYTPMVYSKDAVAFLAEKLGITDEVADIRLSKNLSNCPDILTYRIINL